jgi:hypothetical protein
MLQGVEALGTLLDYDAIKKIYIRLLNCLSSELSVLVKSPQCLSYPHKINRDTSLSPASASSWVWT